MRKKIVFGFIILVVLAAIFHGPRLLIRPPVVFVSASSETKVVTLIIKNVSFFGVVDYGDYSNEEATLPVLAPNKKRRLVPIRAEVLTRNMMQILQPDVQVRLRFRAGNVPLRPSDRLVLNCYVRLEGGTLKLRRSIHALYNQSGNTGLQKTFGDYPWHLHQEFRVERRKV